MSIVNIVYSGLPLVVIIVFLLSLSGWTMPVLVIALVVVSAMMMPFASVTLDGLVNSVNFPCVQIIAPLMENVMKLLQYVTVHRVILVRDASAAM